MPTSLLPTDGLPFNRAAKLGSIFIGKGLPPGNVTAAHSAQI
jgi:hypothetical protein